MTKTENKTHTIYKKDDFAGINGAVIRYTDNVNDMYIKFKGGKEFKTSTKDSKTAMDAMLHGTAITKHEYENY